MHPVLSALRRSHRYVRALAMADPSNPWLETLYRELTAALASLTSHGGAPPAAAPFHLN